MLSIKSRICAFNLAFLAVCFGTAWAHGPVERVVEQSPAELRVFLADATNGDLVALDLPAGKVISRISTPPYIMSLALSTDERYLFTMRGRNTDRDWVTVVSTGKEPGSGTLKPPFVARTLPGATPGPGDHNEMITVGGHDALLQEAPGELIVLNNDQFTGFAPIDVRRYKLGSPDHYFYLESGEHLYIGHLMMGYIQILNRETGKEVGRIEGCPIVHGKAKDEVTGRLFYACNRFVMVLGTRGDEMNKVVGRIQYPQKQRVGEFFHGPDRIFWGYTEGTLPVIYRLDVATEPYALTVVELEKSMRQWITGDGKYLLSLSRSGVLSIHDGNSGKPLRTVTVSKPFDDEYHEHVDKAQLPDIKSHAGKAYISLPHEGRMAVVDLGAGKVEKYFDVGGSPTRIVLVEAPARPERAASQQ